MLVTFGLAWFVTGCVYLPLMPAETHLTAQTVELPARKLHSCLCITATVNGAGRFLLAVDTGATGLILSSDAAAAAKVEFLGKSTRWTGVRSRVGIKFATVRTVQSGDLTLKDINVAVVDSAEFRALMANDRRVDGLIGLVAFGDLVVEMNFPDTKVAVARSARADLGESPKCEYRLTGGVPYLPAVIDTHQEWLMLDTGYEGYLVLPKELFKSDSALGPTVKAPVNPMGVLFDGKVSVGPIALTNPPVVTGIGRVGVRAIDAWKLVFDQQKHWVYFVGPSTETAWEKIEPKMIAGPGWEGKIGASEVQLTTVAKESILYGWGLRSGDLIVTVNGQPASEMWQRFADTSPTGDRSHSPAMLVIERDAEVIKLDVGNAGAWK